MCPEINNEVKHAEMTIEKAPAGQRLVNVGAPRKTESAHIFLV